MKFINQFFVTSTTHLAQRCVDAGALDRAHSIAQLYFALWISLSLFTLWSPLPCSRIHLFDVQRKNPLSKTLCENVKMSATKIYLDIYNIVMILAQYTRIQSWSLRCCFFFWSLVKMNPLDWFMSHLVSFSLILHTKSIYTPFRNTHNIKTNSLLVYFHQF